MGIAPARTVKVVSSKELGFISSLKVAVILVLNATPVAPALGTNKVTVGRVVSGVAPVANVHNTLLVKA